MLTNLKHIEKVPLQTPEERDPTLTDSKTKFYQNLLCKSENSNSQKKINVIVKM